MMKRVVPLCLQHAKRVLEPRESMLDTDANAGEVMVEATTTSCLECCASAGHGEIGRLVRADAAFIIAVRHITQ